MIDPLQPSRAEGYFFRLLNKRHPGQTGRELEKDLQKTMIDMAAGYLSDRDGTERYYHDPAGREALTVWGLLWCERFGEPVPGHWMAHFDLGGSDDF